VVLPCMAVILTTCLWAYKFGVMPWFVIIVVVLDAYIFGIIIVAVIGMFKSRKWSVREFSKEVWERVLKMSHGIMVGIVLWLIYACSVLLYFVVLITLTVRAEQSIFIDYLHRTLEIAFAINLLCIVDFKNNPYTLTKWFFLNRNVTQDVSVVIISPRGYDYD